MAAAAYVSVLTSDEESDDADDGVDLVLARLRDRGKPMKNVGKRVLRIPRVTSKGGEEGNGKKEGMTVEGVPGIILEVWFQVGSP